MKRILIHLGLVCLAAAGGCGQEKSSGTAKPASNAATNGSASGPQETAWQVKDGGGASSATPTLPAMPSTPHVEPPPSALPMTRTASDEPRAVASGSTGLKAPPATGTEPAISAAKKTRTPKKARSAKMAAAPELGDPNSHFPAAAGDPPVDSMPADHGPSDVAAGPSPSEKVRASRLSGLSNSAAAAVDPSGFSTVKVFYATNRQGSDAVRLDGPAIARRFLWPGVLTGAVIGLMVVRRVGRFRARSLQVFTLVGVMAALTWCIYVGFGALKERQAAMRAGRHYGGERGALEMGVCEVTIPGEHEVGEIEAPTIWKLEFREDQKKHVVFVGAEPVENTAYFQQMRERVDKSPRKDAFVFVHGFNVQFDDAAKRTAQIAYDLNFEGAPIFFSWPSQGSASPWAYSVDKENSEWAASDIREFLAQVSKESGAEQIHLIAHSMGNRALTYALRGLAVAGEREPREPSTLSPDEEPRPRSNRPRLKQKFNEVVLTAPDIDAEIFKSQIAPAIQRVAQRVTLYASSHDKALKISQELNGHPRAGDSGAGLVVVRGIDTIDVSAVDTTLVGHSYYGSSDTVLTDIWDLIKSAKGPDMRDFLKPNYRDGLKYWVFEPKQPTAETALQPSEAPRR